MKKIFTSLVVVAGYFFAADNAAAAISVLAATTSNDIFLKFNGTSLSVSNASGYSLGLYYDSDMNDGGLFAWNRLFPLLKNDDGFTALPVSHGVSISSSLDYSNSYFDSSLPDNSYYGFIYDASLNASPVYHYGWVNLTVSNGALTLNSAAINTIAGESILAGQTAVTAVPEPRMWMPSLVLVLGVAFRRRRSRSKATVV